MQHDAERKRTEASARKLRDTDATSASTGRDSIGCGEIRTDEIAFRPAMSYPTVRSASKQFQHALGGTADHGAIAFDDDRSLDQDRVGEHGCDDRVVVVDIESLGCRFVFA